jgi:acetylglutamate/LysW-gamma-L-alpha-aminoadipate kinase
MLVVKVGGGQTIDCEAVADNITQLMRSGVRLILVHGGARLTNEVATALGYPPRFVTSVSGVTSRRTDRRTLEIFKMVYCGQLNKGWVERLQRRGIQAIGLSGIDGRLWEGPRKEAIRIIENGRRLLLRDDFTGKVERVNVGLLHLLMDAGYLPILTPPAISYEGEAINVDGDRAAAATAAALGAERLIILTDVPGLLRHFPDEATLIPHLPRHGLEDALSFAEDRMKKKVMGAAEALQHGVRQVIFADGRIPYPISAALEGRGTVIE